MVELSSKNNFELISMNNVVLASINSTLSSMNKIELASMNNVELRPVNMNNVGMQQCCSAHGGSYAVIQGVPWYLGVWKLQLEKCC